VTAEPIKRIALDAEELAGRRFPYQEDISLVEDVDLVAATPGADMNWLEDVELLSEDGVPAVFDRYSNSFLKIYFPIPAGRENELTRKVLITHLQSGNSYGIRLKEQHCKFPQPAAHRRHRLVAARARGLGAAGPLSHGAAVARRPPRRITAVATHAASSAA
jgi:hypothetical protein